jgi:hypothetical protein
VLASGGTKSRDGGVLGHGFWGIRGARAASLLAPAACRRTLFGKAAEKHRLAACAPQKQNEHKHEDEASAGDEWGESIPGFAPFGLALPKFRFEVSKIIGETFYPVQRL